MIDPLAGFMDQKFSLTLSELGHLKYTGFLLEIYIFKDTCKYKLKIRVFLQFWFQMAPARTRKHPGEEHSVHLPTGRERPGSHGQTDATQHGMMVVDIYHEMWI